MGICNCKKKQIEIVKERYQDEKQAPYHYKIARSYLGQKEIPGKKNNPVIVEMYKSVMGYVMDDEVPWCAALTGHCLKKAGMQSMKSLAARSYLKCGKPVRTPEIGDIVIFWRGKKSGWKGHVAFYAGKSDDGKILVLGGNQSNTVSYKWYPIDRVLGYQRAIEEA